MKAVNDLKKSRLLEMKKSCLNSKVNFSINCLKLKQIQIFFCQPL